MEVTINIDAGGTFTDGFFTVGDTTETAKVPTSAHDLTVCFLDCIQRGAEKLDRDAPDLLTEADLVRFSTTVGTNTVIEKTGPELGLLITDGHEDDRYAGDRPDVTTGFVQPELVEPITERVTADGTLVTEPASEEIRSAVKRLQERGARHILIAFANAYANDANERRAKRVIDAEYPSHYLGALPTSATFEVTARPDDYRRLNTLAINAYIHRPMKSALYKAEDEIRDLGYERPLFIGHSNAGVARVAKSIAINTHNSGPAAGVLGAHALAALYDEDLVAADMGGTSIDISVVADGTYELALTPTIDGLETAIPAIETHNLGAGGGSIATVEDELSVGPESAGANPGPACFARGGQAATVTDADVVRGIVNPDYFLGGQYTLDSDRARQAIEDAVAAPLGVELEEAAHRVARDVQSTIADGIEGRGADIETIVAFGGAGGVHAAGFAEALGLERVILTPYSSVFSAFGESMMDVSHTYTAYVPTVQRDAVETRLDELLDEARRDMRAEGFHPDDIVVGADLLEADGGGYAVRDLSFDPESGLDAHLDGSGGRCLRLHATGPAPKTEFLEHDIADADPQAARKAERDVFWGEEVHQTPTFARADLRPGNVVAGPAVVEAVDTTIAVRPGWDYRIDRYGHGILER